MKNNVQATARVRLTIEIPAKSVWGGDCQMIQIFNQAEAEVKGEVIRMMEQVGVKIIGKPEVIGVATKRKMY